MRRFERICLLLFALAAPVLSIAQSAPTTTHAPSGVTRETIPSIFIPPLVSSPFTATVVMEVVQTLEDGSTVSLYNQRVVMRDRAGRIFQERRTLVPKTGERQPEPWRVEISDPATHQKYFCEMQRRVCQLNEYSAPTSFEVAPAGRLPGGRGDLRREALGTTVVSGVEAEGTRETTVLNRNGRQRPAAFDHA